jgi:hypothetical protein
MLLNWLAIQTNEWGNASQLKLLHETDLHCRDLTLGALESRCIARDSAGPTGSARWAEEEDIPQQQLRGDSLELLYGSIKSKLKYIHNLDTSRAKLVHRLGRNIADAFPELENCKHVKSLFVGGAINSSPAYDQEQQHKLKELSSVACRMKDNEVQYLNWAEGENNIYSNGKKQRSSSSRAATGVASDSHSDLLPGSADALSEARDASAWSALQQELRELQDSQMMGELEEAVSYHMHVAGGVDLRAARGVISSVDTKVNNIVELMRNEVGASDAEYSKENNLLIQQRLREVHERYHRHISALLHNSIDHQAIQQHMHVRYAGTGPVLADTRKRHKVVMLRAAAACEDASPFQLKYVAARRVLTRPYSGAAAGRASSS